MIHSHSAVRSRTLLAALATGPLFLAGCSNTMTPTELSPAITPQAAAVSGHVHGGNQPVAGATVTLYRANQHGFATGATALASTTSSTDGYGAFSFVQSASSPNNNTTNTYSCLVGGTDTNPLLYVVARGGTTTNTAGAVANPNAVFIAPVGSCDALNSSTFVEMSEVVTVATMAALHQFMDPTGTSPTNGIEKTLGADGITVSNTALTNAFNTVSNLVSLSTGMSNAAFTKTGNDPNGGLGVVVTLTPSQAKLNQLANAISSCINYSGSGNPACTTIFNNAPQPANASATSVPGATEGTATDLLTALYNLFTNPTSSGSTASRMAVYGLSPASGAPYQPTLSTVPNDWAMTIAYSSASTCAGSTAAYMNQPAGLSIDSYGDVWFGSSQSTIGSLGHLAANGLPASCTVLNPGGHTVLGAQTTVDTMGNIYSALVGVPSITRFTPSTSASTPVTLTATEAVTAMAVDGTGNLFYTSGSYLYEVAGAASGGTTSTLISSTLPSPSSTQQMIIDAQGRIWVVSQGNIVSYTQNQSGSYVTTTVSQSTPQYDITVGATGTGTQLTTVYTVSSGSNSVQNFSITNGNVVTQGTAFAGGGSTQPTTVALDGAANTWAATSNGSMVAAYDANGNSLASTTGLSKSAADANGTSSIAVDAAGDVWLASTGNTVSEFVGAGVPVYQSLAQALGNNRFQAIP